MEQQGLSKLRILMNAIENPETCDRCMEIVDRITELEEKGFATGEIDRLWVELEDLGNSSPEVDVKI